jgi:hypothetical protein
VEFSNDVLSEIPLVLVDGLVSWLIWPFHGVLLSIIIIIIIITSSYSYSSELNNFLDTHRMGTPLRGCKAPSICTNVLGLRPMGWSVRWQSRGSIITFAETLKTKEIVTIDLANQPKNLART